MSAARRQAGRLLPPACLLLLLPLAATPAERGDDPPFEWRLPPGFPAPLVPPDNPMTAAKVELGRHLFYDRRLSGNGTQACASCHRQELAFTDGRARALGSTGEVHPRSAMSLANAAYNASLTWADPRLNRLEDQALVPMFNREPVELGLAGRKREILARFAADPDYVRRFRAAFPGDRRPVTLRNLTRALAAFQRTLLSGGSAYDRLLFFDDRSALSAAARRGLDLFFSPRLGCSDCHSGFNLSGPVVHQAAPKVPLAFHNTGLYNLGGRGLYPGRDPGLAQVTGRRRDTGRFRAPTLRNIALTAPYMHDGSVATLGEVLDHYAAGGRTLHAGPYAGDGSRSPYKSPRVGGFELSSRDKDDLLAFLASLTDHGFVTDARFADPFGGSQ